MVPNFYRLAASVYQTNRRYLPCVVDHFFDDFFKVEPSLSFANAECCLQNLCSAMGIELDLGKNQPAFYKATVLGVVFDLSRLLSCGSVASPKPTRVPDLPELAEVLELDLLSPSHSARLPGTADFVATTLYSTVGQTCLSASMDCRY